MSDYLKGCIDYISHIFSGKETEYAQLNEALRILNEQNTLLTAENNANQTNDPLWTQDTPKTTDYTKNITFLIDLLKALAKYNKKQDDKYLEAKRYKKNHEAIEYISKELTKIQDINQQMIKTLVSNITNDKVQEIKKLKQSYKLNQYMFGALRVLSIILMLSAIPMLLSGELSGAFVMLFIGLALNKLTYSPYTQYTEDVKELDKRTKLETVNNETEDNNNSFFSCLKFQQ